MDIEIDLRSEPVRARLVAPDDVRSFKAVLLGGDPALEQRLAPAGVVRLEEHVWIEIEAVRRLAGEAATPAWEEAFAGMLAFARTKGWVDDERGAVRAHVERRA